jgi:hypothetical protein
VSLTGETEEIEPESYARPLFVNLVALLGDHKCLQGDTYQKPVTEPSLGGAILNIGYSIAQTNCEGKRTSDWNRAKLGVASAPGKPWPVGQVLDARSGKNMCQTKDLRIFVVAQRLLQLGRKLGLDLIQQRHQITSLVQ